VNQFNIEEKTILELQKAMEKNMITSKELVIMYLERIANIDHAGHKLNSVLEINPDAIQIAEALDYERTQKGKRSNLHGIPILIKDNIGTADKMHTSAGSFALKDSYSKEDAFVIKQLRKAGAVILGKTNMTEWANFMTNRMPPGYSSRGGQVLNPYGIGEFGPGGSSSGSGVAATANLCALAIGTETSGSIIDPASNLSLVGIKPSIGLVSRYGIIPASHMQDTAGPMGRTVEDAVILFGEMAGYDENDPITIYSNRKDKIDYTQFLKLNGFLNRRIGVPRDYFFDNISEEEKEIFEQEIKIMKQLGAEIVENIKIENAKELNSKTAVLCEFIANLDTYLAGLSTNVPVHSVSELIKYHEENADTMLKFGQVYFTEYSKKIYNLTSKEYVINRKKDIELSKNGIDSVLKNYNLDALVFIGESCAEIVNKAGYPEITVPAGVLKNGKPFGITFVAEAFSEPKLINIAYTYEQSSKKRVMPKLN
jgi:amidase